jgi:mannose-6-phosphate isomerase-like protein (cupin superfamily)
VERHDLADLLAEGAASGKPYLEFVRSESLSVGLYVLPAGSVDGQQPHAQDEVYVVMSGSGQFTAGGETRPVNPGMTFFVPAGMRHWFHDIESELRLIVVFAPPETLPEAGPQAIERR